MIIKQKNILTIFLFLFCIGYLPIAANSFSVSYEPYIYAAGYKSESSSSDFLQAGNSTAVKYMFKIPDISTDLFAGVGYSYLFDTRISGLEFVKGFSSVFIETGIIYYFSDNISLSGFIRMHNSHYSNTKTYFAHIEAGISPNLAFVKDIDNKYFNTAISFTFPLTIDIRKDLLYAFSFGVGLSIEFKPIKDIEL